MFGGGKTQWNFRPWMYPVIAMAIAIMATCRAYQEVSPFMYVGYVLGLALWIAVAAKAGGRAPGATWSARSGVTMRGTTNGQ